MSNNNENVHIVDVGDVAPEFSLLDAMGQRYTLSELTVEQTVVLVFYRGDW